MDDNKYSNLGSRSEKTSKKRKANRIYNILLTIVILAIIAVAVSIFTGNDDEQTNQAENNIAEKNDVTNNESDNKINSDKETEDETSNKEEDASEEDADREDTDQEEGTEENTIVENSGDSNVVETYVNDSWKPIGTTQTGEHITSYTKDSVDWQEMEKALAYGAGLSESDITVWYIGNGGSANKAIGTVSPKDHSKTYRVYIEWVNGEGWMPIKVELLKVNDKITR